MTMNQNIQSKIKDKINEDISILLFYQYVNPKWNAQRTKDAINFLENIAIELNLGGRLRVAEEGINATITGTLTTTRKFIDELQIFDWNFNNGWNLSSTLDRIDKDGFGHQNYLKFNAFKSF